MDTRTVIESGLAVSLAVNLAMAVVFWTRHTYPGFGYWLTGTLCRTAALTLLLLPRDQFPPWLTIILPNYAMLLELMLYVRGTHLFRGVPIRFGWEIIVSLSFIGLILYFSYNVPSLSIRFLILSIYWGFLECWLAWLLLTRRPAYFGSGDWLQAAVWIVLIVSNVVRVGLVWTSAETLTPGIATLPLSQNLLFLLIIMSFILIALSQKVMNAQRLEYDYRVAQEQLEQVAYHDALTGLPNRRLLHDRLTLALTSSKRSGLGGALMLLDLDNFKPLNDEHGHAVGDLLLIEVARRLSTTVREVDTVARLGGDEFVVVLNGLSADEAVAGGQARMIAEKIRFALARPYILTVTHDGGADAIVEHCCTASIGGALFDRGADQESILKRADKAMYQAKDVGRDAVVFVAGSSQSSDLVVSANFVHLHWHSAYECGHPLIDAQHRGLFEIANRLLTAILSDHSKDEVAMLIDLLVRDISQHFQDEEAIIEAAGFPGAPEHAVIHRQLVETAADLVARFHPGLLGVGELFEFLAQDVVAWHILGEDRKFFSYLDERG